MSETTIAQHIALRTKHISIALGVCALLGLSNAPAKASFLDMTVQCTDMTGVMIDYSCGSDPLPKHIVSTVPLDGHAKIWESWDTTGYNQMTVHLSGTYDGPMTGDRIDYYLGLDKDVENWTGQVWRGFDILVWGDPNWEPIIMSDPYPVDMSGMMMVKTMDAGGIWFDGYLPDSGTTGEFWLGMSIPLHLMGDGTVYGHFTMMQIPKIPEPGTLALFGLGLAGLSLARRRKAA